MTLDQNADLSQQYADSRNLEARIRLHQEFSTAPRAWFDWLFDFYTFPPQARLLEVGCGSARFWTANLHRLPPGWDITLTDFSAGMLDDARANLGDAARRFTFRQVDVQAIPFADDRFEGVIANHMLYHVPDRPSALAEIRRVLAPEGFFIAATNGENHLKELVPLLIEALPHFAEALRTVEASRLSDHSFRLHNGASQLAPYFSDVQIHRFADSFHVTEVEPLLAYILSGHMGAASSDDIAHLREFLEARIDRDGAIDIQKDSGVFICRA